MTVACELAETSVGKKALMAVTGVVLLGFIGGHLAGNLLIFAGQDALNGYAKKLRDLGPLLWAARAFLLANLIVHIGVAIALARDNRSARPVPYSFRSSRQTTYAARTMLFSGFIVLGFLIYHLLHFTFRVTHPGISNFHDALGRHDVFSMVVLSFRDPTVSAAYVAAQGLLALHLSHGFASLFQSLGLNNENTQPCLGKLGHAAAFLIFAGYISIPVAVFFGLVHLPMGAGA